MTIITYKLPKLINLILVQDYHSSSINDQNENMGNSGQIVAHVTVNATFLV